jgi:hypothetical protein
LVCCGVVVSAWLGVQWWPSHAPRDYEECSDGADKSTSSKDERASLIAQCDKQFIGRRKAGGGYTYYDLLQDRHFEIAGPNPTPEELKSFDEAYVSYLNTQRRDTIAAALAETQPQPQTAETASQDDQSLTSQPSPVGPPLVITPNSVPIPKPASRLARSKTRRCEDATLSCKWTRFSAGMKSFFGSYAKANHP